MDNGISRLGGFNRKRLYYTAMSLVASNGMPTSSTERRMINYVKVDILVDDDDESDVRFRLTSGAVGLHGAGHGGQAPHCKQRRF